MPMPNASCKTRGEVEAAIANAIADFHRQHHGRGPSHVRVLWDRNLVTVYSQGIFTRSEVCLLTSGTGCLMVKSMRQELHRIVRPEVEAVIAAIVEFDVIRSTIEVDIPASEQVEVYELQYH